MPIRLPPSSAAVHVLTAEMKSSEAHCPTLVHVCNGDTCMILLLITFFTYRMSSTFSKEPFSQCWSLLHPPYSSKTLKFHTHSPKHEITRYHSIHGPLTSISYLVTLFYPPFAFLWWIEVKTTAGKNLFSIQSKSSY